MKRIIILSSALVILASASAYADSVSFGVNVGEPAYPAYPAYAAPTYVEPGYGYVMAPDWPSEHYDRHRHRHDDYWARHEREERGRGREEEHRRG